MGEESQDLRPLWSPRIIRPIVPQDGKQRDFVCEAACCTIQNHPRV